MALYDRSRDQQQLDPIDPGYTRAPLWAGNMIPILLAVAVALIVIGMVYPRATTERVGDRNNAGPSVQTVTPVAPGPVPSTDRRNAAP